MNASLRYWSRIPIPIHSVSYGWSVTIINLFTKGRSRGQGRKGIQSSFAHSGRGMRRWSVGLSRNHKVSSSFHSLVRK